MSELRLPRLLAAAKEFNIGRDTLIEFLVGKGFNRDDLNGNVKLTESMYHSLQDQFRDDKVAKDKADRIEIPKGVQMDKKKKEEETVPSAGTEATVSTPSPEPLVTPASTTPVDSSSTPPTPPAEASKEKPVQEEKAAPEVKAEPAKPAVEEAPVAAPEAKEAQPRPAEAKPVVPAEPKVEPVAQPQQEPEKKDTPSAPAPAPVAPAVPVTEKKKTETTPQTEIPAPAANAPEPGPVAQKEKPQEKPAAPTTPETVKIAAPEIEGPRILDKIDLSAIDSSTRPKKGHKKENKAQQGQQHPQHKQPAAQPPHARETHHVKPEHVTPESFKFTESKKTIVLPGAEHPEAGQNEAPVITKISADKIEGPKILGKIELPVDNDTRPKTGKDEKRKRKRIPIDKRGSDRGPANGARPPFNRDGNRGPQNRSGQQQPGNRQGGPAGNDRRGGRNNFRDNNRGGRSHTPEEIKEIDQKKIQEKIRETQAKLAGASGRGKSQKAKHRREHRRELEAERGEQTESHVLNVTEFITVSELANLMDVSFTDIISKCMSLGIMVSINQRLDAEVIELVAGEFGYTVSFINLGDEEEEEEEEEEDDEANLVPRSPIVTIMGHVDHGKTSLLDYIRNANVVAGEAGGITQHIGAYVVTLENGKKITFLDTPGHEAFTAMRARGAKITDMAVIVIAADDAVMPQTKEAISHAQAAGIPMIFAINKIDKEGANPAKIYEQLSNMNILVEEWGGKFQNQEISAKKGTNVNVLLEKILLEAEMLNLRANPNREASGNIIEASLDKGRGYVATVLVQNGTLHQGDIIVSGQHYGRAKAMFNERNQRITTAGPSTPVQILGLNGAPQAGEKFRVYADESEAKEIATTRARIMREQGLRTRKHITLDEIGRRLALGSFKELNIIIKGDVDGSVEALSDSLQKLSTEEIVVNVIYKAVGQISESDVLLATASDAIIVGFNVRASSQAAKLAHDEGVQIRTYSIIYNAIEEIKSAMEGMLEPKVEEVEAATVEVREVYKFDKVTVAGCYVQEGKIKRDYKIRIFRDGILVYPRAEGAYAELGSLKRFKDDVKEVAQGYECGLTVKNFADIQVGDNIVAYQEEEVKRTL